MIATQKNKTQVENTTKFKGMRFCTNCDNMLEPFEYREGERAYL